MRNLDLPPLWLVLFIVMVWTAAQALPDWVVATDELDGLGRGFVIVGVALTAFALWSFRKHKTTPVPHRRASAIITTGVYDRTRNPIYLADVFILTGAILWIGFWPALIIVPLFMLLLQRRFILPEETRLKEDFPAEFAEWAQKTRRWL